MGKFQEKIVLTSFDMFRHAMGATIAHPDT